MSDFETPTLDSSERLSLPRDSISDFPSDEVKILHVAQGVIAKTTASSLPWVEVTSLSGKKYWTQWNTSPENRKKAQQISQVAHNTLPPPPQKVQRPPVPEEAKVLERTFSQSDKEQAFDHFLGAFDSGNQIRDSHRQYILEEARAKVPQGRLCMRILEKAEFQSKGAISQWFHMMWNKLFPSGLAKIDKDLYRQAVQKKDIAYLAEATLLGRGTKQNRAKALEYFQSLPPTDPTRLRWQHSGNLPELGEVQVPTSEALLETLKQPLFGQPALDALRLLALNPPSDTLLKTAGITAQELQAHLQLLAEDGDLAAQRKIATLTSK